MPALATALDLLGDFRARVFTWFIAGAPHVLYEGFWRYCLRRL